MIKCKKCKTNLVVEDKNNYKCWKCGFKKGKGEYNGKTNRSF